MVPGKPASKAAIVSMKAWAGLEEQEEISHALLLDAQDVLTEKVNNTYVAEDNPSDDEQEPEDNDDVESTGAAEGGGMPPPPFAALSSFFGPLEQYAASCGNYEAGNFLRKARMSFLAAYASNKRGR